MLIASEDTEGRGENLIRVDLLQGGVMLDQNESNQKIEQNDRKLCVLASGVKAKQHSNLRFNMSLYHFTK